MFADAIAIEGVYILAILGGAGSVIAYLFHSLITAKDKEMTLAIKEKDRMLLELEGMKKSYQEIAAEAVKGFKEVTNFYRAKEGKPPLLLAPPVVSESHSPSTAMQRETASIQTMRAAMVKLKEETGQEPREEPPHAAESTSTPKPTESPPPMRVTIVKTEETLPVEVKQPKPDPEVKGFS